MKGKNRRALLAFVGVGSTLGLGLFAVVTSLAPAVNGVLAFAGGFGGALLLSAMVPRLRRHLLETFAELGDEFRPQPSAELLAATPQPKQRPGADRSRPAPALPEAASQGSDSQGAIKAHRWE